MYLFSLLSSRNPVAIAHYETALLDTDMKLESERSEVYGNERSTRPCDSEVISRRLMSSPFIGHNAPERPKGS